MNALRNFDFANAEISLWVVKNTSARSGERYLAWCLQITDAVVQRLRGIVIDEIATLHESQPFTALAENGEGQALEADVTGSAFDFLRAAVDQVHAERELGDLRLLENALGYVVRFQVGGSSAYAVKRVATQWKPRRAGSIVSLVFSNGEFDLQENRSLELANNIDFIVLEGTAYIKSKRNFESVLQYKEHYTTVFQTMKQSHDFAMTFSDLDFVERYVGTNSVHLRRMCVIEEKGFYKDLNFRAKLVAENASQNWGIQFDAQNRIIPSDESMRAILHCLLDHRLHSSLSDNTYDVSSTIEVAQ